MSVRIDICTVVFVDTYAPINWKPGVPPVPPPPPPPPRRPRGFDRFALPGGGEFDHEVGYGGGAN